MNKPMVAAFAATLVLAGCDLPTTADEARDHLGRNQEERVVPFQIPMPEMSVTLADQMEGLSGIVDTTDLSFSLDPDTFAFGLDSLLMIDPIDPDAVSQGYDLVVEDFTRDITVSLPAVPLSLPSTSTQSPLVPTTGGTLPGIPMSFSGIFTTATFGAGSALHVEVTTDNTATITELDASIESSGGTVASSSGSITLAGGETDTLVIDLGGTVLPDSVDLVLSFTGSSGDGSSDELQVQASFVDAQVTAATGVDTANVTSVSFSETVALDQAGADFSEATLDSGTVTVTSFDSGTLDFTPTFDGDLAGLQIGGTTPDQLVVSGDVGAHPDSATVDIASSASLTIAFTNLKVASVTLDSVTMNVDQTVAVETGGGMLDNLSEVTIESGFLSIAVDNRLDVTGDVTLTLNGLTDTTGAVLTTTFQLQPSPTGEVVTTTDTVDLADAVLDPAALEAVVSGAIAGTDVVVTPEIAADALTIDPYLEMQPRRVVLSGVPDMEVVLDEQVSIDTDEIDLGEMGDILDQISFNDVTFTVTIDNATGLDVQLADFGMVLLDSAGNAVVDAAGDTARVSMSNDTTGTIVFAPANTATGVIAEAAAFVNELLNRVGASEDVGIATRGVLGPAADSGEISLGDSISVIFEIALGPNITIDPSGITMDQVTHNALELEETTTDLLVDLSENLDSASVEFEVVNAMPFGMAIAIGLAPTPADTTDTIYDPFTAANNIVLPGFTVEPAGVDAEGRVETPWTGIVTLIMDPQDFGNLEGNLSMGFEATITGPAGGGPAQLQPTDSLVLRPLLKLRIRVGGGGQ